MEIARPQFHPFDEHRAVRVYQRNLPHWRQDGATYFVTIRAADSIPDSVTRQWADEKCRWLAARGISIDGRHGDSSLAVARLPLIEQWRFEKHFNRRVQSCLDRGLGACHLRNHACIEILKGRLFSGDGSDYHLGDFVIMPNHVHLLITPIHGHELEQILKNLKGASAVECNRALARSGTFWQADSYDHIVRSLEQALLYRAYIADNPGKARVSIPVEAWYVAKWMDEWIS